MGLKRALTAAKVVVFSFLVTFASPTEPAASEDVAAKFEAFEKKYLSIGRFRTDQYPADAPFEKEDLERNFLEIALRLEYAVDGSKAADAPYEVLKRWEGPVRYRFQGDGVTDEYVDEYADYAKTLSSLTGLSIEMSEADANLDILIIGPEQRKAISEQVEAATGEGHLIALREWLRGDDSPCHGRLEVNADDVIVKGTIFIRSEIKNLMRETCIQEELSQLLGLLNDSYDARPSIFNDDQEFIRLTLHDQYLLGILYHERVRPGMTVEDLTPILPGVVDEVLSGG